MESHNIFLIIVAFGAGFLATIWTTNTFYNTFLKFVFFVISIWAIFLFLGFNGYVIKTASPVLTQPKVTAPL